MAVVSAKKVRLQQRAEAGDPAAIAALELVNEPNRFLSTVQVGITLVSVFAGALGGEKIARDAEAYLARFPALAPYSEALGLGLVVLTITYFSLVFGELVPKRIALNHAERIASGVARPVRLLSQAAAPVVWILSKSTDLVLRVLAQRPSDGAPVTSEEIRLLVHQATEGGGLRQVEEELVEAVLDSSRQRVGDLMTPRPLIEWIDLHAAVEGVIEQIAASSHERFPAASGDLDQVQGTISARRALEHVRDAPGSDFREIVEPVIFVGERQPALTLLDLFRGARSPIAIVLEEHGGVAGLVTLTDLLDALTGDQLRLGRRKEHQSTLREDGAWLLDGLTSLDDLRGILQVRDLPGEGHGRYQSLGGFVFTQLGEVPSAGDSFEWGEWHFEVAAMDRQRIDKVLIAPTSHRGST